MVRGYNYALKIPYKKKERRRRTNWTSATNRVSARFTYTSTKIMMGQKVPNGFIIYWICLVEVLLLPPVYSVKKAGFFYG